MILIKHKKRINSLKKVDSINLDKSRQFTNGVHGGIRTRDRTLRRRVLYIRTRDRTLRRRVLYPAELRRHLFFDCSYILA